MFGINLIITSYIQININNMLSQELRDKLDKYMRTYNYTKLGDYLIIKLDYLTKEAYHDVIKAIVDSSNKEK